MKKKNLLTAALSLSLVAVITVGATLAYFTDTTDAQTNVFTTGNVNIQMTDKTESTDPNVKVGGYEYDAQGNQTGILYTNVLPGDTLSKKVAVEVLDGNLVRPASSNAHVGILVMIDEEANPSSEELYKLVNEAVGRMEAVEGDIWGDPEDVSYYDAATGTRVTGKFYTYNPYAAGKGWEKGVPAGTTLKLFDDIQIPRSWGNAYASSTFDITVQAYAIQADHLAYTQLVDAVRGNLKVDGETVKFEQVAD